MLQNNGQLCVSLLIGPCERLNLEFERLRVLPLDLHFGLQFFDEKIKPSDFRTQFLYVRSCRSGSARRRAWLLQILLRRRSITRTRSGERFGERSRPNGLWGSLIASKRSRGAGTRSRRRWREQTVERVWSCGTFHRRCVGGTFRFKQTLYAANQFLRLKRLANQFVGLHRDGF